MTNDNTCPNCGGGSWQHYKCACGIESSNPNHEVCDNCGLPTNLWPRWREMRKALETIRQKSVCVALYRPYCPHCVVEKALKGGAE